MGRIERRELIHQLQLRRRSHILCYLTSDRPNADAAVQKDVMPLFYEHLRHADHYERIEVLLFTQGGDTLAAFGLGRLLREFAPEISTLVPEKCHSAGTLFALGSNQIVMTRLATLSPIDPSITGPLNPVVEIQPGQRQLVPVSVESVAGFRDLLTKVWDVKDETSLASAFKILAECVHPLALGDVARVREQIERLARKLLSNHREDAHSINSIVTTLTKGLGTHDYLISRTEARELLGTQIASDDGETEKLIWQLYQDFATEMSLGKPFDPGRELHAVKAAGESQLAQSAAQLVQTQQLAQATQVQAAQAAQVAQVAQAEAAQAAQNGPPEQAEQAAQAAEAAQYRAAQAQGVAQATAAQAIAAQQAAAQAQATHQAQTVQLQNISARVVLPLAIVESQVGSHVCEREVVVSEQQVPMQIPGGPFIGQNKVMCQEVVRAEWVFLT